MTVGFLGSGRMATALARGLLAQGLCQPGDIAASSPDAASRADFTRDTGADALPSNAEVCARCDTLVLAVKPALVRPVLAELVDATAGRLLVSIAAGIPLHVLETASPRARHVRAMPNTPAQIGAGATAYALGSTATDSDSDTAARILGSVGLAVPVPETLLDAVTGLSGSGPAYIFRIIEALIAGGVANGLTPALARDLATQTVFGAARLVQETREDPAVLRANVTSPNGTTVEGLQVLEARGVPDAIVAAVTAATRRAAELGRAS
jgi:pyrroline-5-carboxylate reductase